MRTSGGFNLRLNPVLARESRVRMRGWKAPGLITLYVFVLGLIVTICLLIASERPATVFAPELGSALFIAMTITQFILVCIAAPGMTAGVIAGERERQTLDLLLVTRLSPIQVVLGKLGAALSFTILLIVASLPVYSLLFFLGGVSFYRMALTVLIDVVTAVLLGSIGIYFSALFKRTQPAVVASYSSALSLLIFPLLFSILVFEVFNRPPDTPPAISILLGYMNPLFGLFAAAGGPLGDMTSLYRDLLTTPELQEAIWWKFSLLAIAASALILWRTARRIRPS